MKNFILKINRALAAKKKSIFILAALFAATFANAQITLEHSFVFEQPIRADHYAYCGPCSYINKVTSNDTYKSPIALLTELPCPFYYKLSVSGDSIKEITFINQTDYSTYKTINLSSYKVSPDYAYGLYAVAYDVFAVDKIAIIFCDYTNRNAIIMDEDGNILKTLIGCIHDSDRLFIIDKIDDQWKLITPTYDNNRYQSSVEVYTFPGDGSEPQTASDTATPSSSKRSSRKIVREGQVLVETENNTYTLQGQEVK